MDPGAVDALVGVGAGAVLGFASAQLTGWLRRRSRGRAAARLVWTELSRSEALADGAREFGPGPSPVVPRFVFWESHAGELAEIVDPDALIDLEVAYGSAEMLGRLVMGEEIPRGSAVEFEEYVARIRQWISDGKAAIEPYARHRPWWAVLSPARARPPISPPSDRGKPWTPELPDHGDGA